MLIKSINPAVSCEYSSIRKIIIYGHGEKLYTADSGYFEECKISNGELSTVYHGQPLGFTLSTEPKNARKENLNRNDNYLLKYYGDYSFENGYHLYIHESEISVSPAGEHVLFSTSGETNYCNAVTLHFTHGATMERLKMERVPEAGKDFTPPEGCKWSDGYSKNPEKPFYDIIHPRSFGNEPRETVVVKRWRETEIVYDLLVRCYGYSKTEKTPERLHREKLAAIINENKVFSRTVSHYDIERLLQYFDITIKEGAKK